MREDVGQTTEQLRQAAGFQCALGTWELTLKGVLAGRFVLPKEFALSKQEAPCWGGGEAPSC